ncbi:MAG TPA: hypothetical protein VGC40_05805 [Paenirhodobacter sp.]
MRVKETVLTFVAMGGFAVPVLFETPAASASLPCTQPQTAQANAAPDTPKPTKGA